MLTITKVLYAILKIYDNFSFIRVYHICTIILSKNKLLFDKMKSVKSFNKNIIISCLKKHTHEKIIKN